MSWCAAISLAVLLGFSPTLHAKQARKPSLEGILQRLEANLNHYDTAVPSLFCDEHVISRMEQPGPLPQDVITDSIFRLSRIRKPDHTTTLVESREIQRVDGKPATSQNMDGPSLLSGAFEGAQAVVSINQSACMNYELLGTNGDSPNQPYIIRFATVLNPRNSTNCILQEQSTGRVFIDPASMHVTRLELTTPRHAIIPGDAWTPPVIGKRVVTIDYASVLLGNQTFWMPSAITMRNTTGFGFHRIVWSFRATYRNYHRLEVTSRIIPGSEALAR